MWRTTLGVTVGLTLLAAGCVSRESGSSSGHTLVFKYGRIAGPADLMQTLLERFHRENPSVTVSHEVLPSSTDQQHQYYAINPEGRHAGIDVMALDVIWVQEFARAGWIEDVTDRWPLADRADLLPGPLAASTWRGRLFAVPWYCDAGVLYCRKDLLSRYRLPVPTTVDELAASARRVLDGEVRPDLHGFLWQGKQYEGLVCAVLEMLRGLGGDVLDDSGRVVLDSPVSIRALERVRALIETDRVTPPIVTTLDEEASRILFQRGNAVFLRNWPYAQSLFEAAESPVRGKVTVASVPGGVMTGPPAGYLGSNSAASSDPNRSIVHERRISASHSPASVQAMNRPKARLSTGCQGLGR
jgi:multiple sugar transport system substrate-binding protein